ncbi:PGPGW domain-containing protein [Parvularcula oceani]|uniref:PGPGW domain-containing protein n=1 Tax=Parvularcula oceani TaxID=1247963 RepID=UPI0004E16818|nr:PGPGW domain-containing protein [Parvularcula oceani]
MDAVSAGLLALAHKVAGSVMLLFGVVLFPLPIPFGLILIALGLAFLAPYVAPARAVIRALRSRAPLLDRAMAKYAHRCPSVVRTAIERTAPIL